MRSTSRLSTIIRYDHLSTADDPDPSPAYPFRRHFLREYLEPLGITQSAFAKHIGITNARFAFIVEISATLQPLGLKLCTGVGFRLPRIPRGRFALYPAFAFEP